MVTNISTCRHAASRRGQHLEALAGRVGLRPDGEGEAPHRLFQEIAPAGAEQAADQPDAHVARHPAHHLGDVAGDEHADDAP